MDRGTTCIPVWLRDHGIGHGNNSERRPNLFATAQHSLEHLGLDGKDLFHHVPAVLHAPVYRETNAGALRMEWPSIPLPGWLDSETERSGGSARTIGGTGLRAGPAARPRYARSWDHGRNSTSGNRCHRGSGHDGREHCIGRCPTRAWRDHVRRVSQRRHLPAPLYLPLSGIPGSVATRRSRSGFSIANTPSLATRPSPRKSIAPDELRQYSIENGDHDGKIQGTPA